MVYKFDEHVKQYSSEFSCFKKSTVWTQSSHLHVYLLVIDAVLIVDVQQFVFDPADLLGRLFPSLVVQTVFFIKLSQTHHGFFTHSPLERPESTDTDLIQKSFFFFLQK